MTLRLNINLILRSSALAEDLDCLMSFIHSTAVGDDFHLTLAALKLLLDLVEDKTASKENKSSLYKTGRGHSSLSNLSAQMQVLHDWEKRVRMSKILGHLGHNEITSFLLFHFSH